MSELLPASLSLVMLASRRALLTLRVSRFEEGGPGTGSPAVCEIGLRIQSPDGSPGTHAFPLFSASSAPSLARVSWAGGFFAEPLEGLTLEESRRLADGGRALVARVPSRTFPFTMTAEISRPLPVRRDEEWVSWHASGNDLVRRPMRWTHSMGALAFGEAVAPAGSPLFDFMGGRRAGAAGYYSRSVVAGWW